MNELRNSVLKRATLGVNRGSGAAENTGMSRIWLGISVLALSGVVVAQVSQEQPSLGAVAKATKEQRAKAAAAKAGSKTPVKFAPVAKTANTENRDEAAGKKYTNDNLDGRPRPSSPTAYRTAAKGAPMVKSGGDGKDEAYWRRRAEPIRQQLGYSTERLNVAKKRLESLKADEGLDVAVANGRSSTAQGERQRQASLVLELESQVQYLEQRMKNLEDEGRKAGALPGWFR
jgi:hypothetical protein